MSSLIRRTFFILFILGAFALSDSHAFAATRQSIHVSNNWAGYAAADGAYTNVSGSWVVPESTRTSKAISADAAWVGIGGISTDDLIQAGTQTIIRNGRTEYMAWYELLPDGQTIVPLAITPGDEVSASITEVTPGFWHIILTNLTTSQSYQTTVAYDSSHSSAEWIVERPLAVTNDATGYLPLSNFGDVTFTDAMATADGRSDSIDDTSAGPLIMAGSSSRILAAPQRLRDGSFTVSYLTSPQSTRYLRSLRRTYIIQHDTTTSSRTQSYQEINTNYVIRVVFDESR